MTASVRREEERGVRECGREFTGCTRRLTGFYSFGRFKANLTVKLSTPIVLALFPDTVMKSCTYKGFCEKAYGTTAGAKMECCSGDDCNGPHKSRSHGHHNSAGALASSPVLLASTLLLRMALSQL